jgi:molybdopterin-guanine dinucleotide biosynthesis protein B
VPKIVAVVGGKHSGKTTVVEHLVAELKLRGFRVGVVKEMVRIPTLDTPATETDRYAKAGAEVIAAVPREETVIFIKKRLAVDEILSHLGVVDFVVLEGFENEHSLQKIVAAKTADEARSFIDISVIGVSGLILESADERKKAEEFRLPIFSSLTEATKLADLVQHLDVR